MDRLALQEALVEILGVSNVYFQPSTNVKLQYPCIVYELKSIDGGFANDKRYITHRGYQITHIYQHYQNNLQDKMIEKFDYISFITSNKVDGLYQDIYTIYC